MENQDPRRRHRREESSDESGGGRESWRDRPEYEPEHRRELGSSDYGSRERERDRDNESRYGRQDEGYGRGREQPRYGRGGPDERSRYSPDWSQQGAEPRYSEDPYYARNRDHERSSEHPRGESGGWRGDENRRTTAEQRARGFTPREQFGRDEEQESHYRGYYSREVRPFSYPGGSGALYMESWTLAGPYTGRGPKGYKRSDEQMIDEACQRLERDGHIDATEIEVTAEDGVIRLRGTVPDRSMKRRAEEAVESIYGARDVMNELRVSAPGEESSQATRSAERSRESRKSQASTTASQASSTSQTATPSGATGTGSSSESQKH